MKLAELKAILDQTGLPVFYGLCADSPELPYIVFVRTDAQTSGSDYGNELRREGYSVELYSVTKDPDNEAGIEQVLDAHGIPYSCTEAYIDSEEMHQCAYDIEFYYKRG